jgi:CheY-like chemotaxis protein
MPKVSSPRVLFVDDTSQDRDALVAALGKGRGLSVHALPPPTEPDASGIPGADAADAFLLDYQLSAHEAGRAVASYKGSTLAAALREKLPKIPILLVTRRKIFSSGRAAAARDVSSAFDDLYIKEDIYKDPKRFAKELLSLVDGYRRLGAVSGRDWASLRSILGAEPEEDDLLLAADPPSEVVSGKAWRISEVARWIRKTLLAMPGVLYDPLHASVALGISESSFLRASVQKAVARARYSGPFSTTSYFWKRRLLLRAHEILAESGMGASSLADFARAWRHKRRQNLQPAVCNTSGESPADCVCHVLRQPVLRRYSLAYNPEGRPRVMDDVRVSFKAIQTTNHYDERLFPPDARALLRKIQKGQAGP